MTRDGGALITIVFLAEDSHVTHFEYTPFVIPLALSAVIIVAMARCISMAVTTS